jgi:hypothetical protein
MREVGHFAWCTRWLGIVDNVQTRIIELNEDIFIPELDFKI